jgi:transposase
VCTTRVGGQAEAAIEEQVFGTFTQDLERLRTWLKKSKVRQVAMESTGVYWIPIWNVLERGFTLTLVNPATVRALQGQKTDRIDARRIAEYLQHGLLRGSFIPAKPIRELRELTRMRVHIQQDRNRVINRIARLLETVNIKLACVASHIVGASGMAMLRLLARGVSRCREVGRLRAGPYARKDSRTRVGAGGAAGCAFSLDACATARQAGSGWMRSGRVSMCALTSWLFPTRMPCGASVPFLVWTEPRRSCCWPSSAKT